ERCGPFACERAAQVIRGCQSERVNLRTFQTQQDIRHCAVPRRLLSLDRSNFRLHTTAQLLPPAFACHLGRRGHHIAAARYRVLESRWGGVTGFHSNALFTRADATGVLFAGHEPDLAAAAPPSKLGAAMAQTAIRCAFGNGSCPGFSAAAGE